MKRKVGIMGGTFNPIHIAHLCLAQEAAEQMGLDRVLFIPSGCSYLKDQAEIADSHHRLEMVKIAVADNARFEVSDIEITREGNSYTYETLDLLHKENPEDEYYLILGADNLFTMEKWFHPERIFASAHILAAVRGDKDTPDMELKIQDLKRCFGANITLLKMRHMDISSTDIRKRLSQGISCKYLVPDEVIAYMKENHLYLSE